MNDLNIMSQNVHGLNNCIKRKILQQLKKEKGNILFLQETQRNTRSWAGFFLLSPPPFFLLIQVIKEMSSYYNKRSYFQKMNSIVDKGGRFVLVVGRIESIEITLTNIYYPPDEGTEFMNQITDLIVTQGKGIIIICGDFNLILNPNLASTTGAKHKSEKSAYILRRACRELGMIHVWRTLRPRIKDYTYYSNRHSTYIRLDYFFMFNKDITTIKNGTIGTKTLSDHATVTLTVKLN